MRSITLLGLLCAALLSVGPAFAHGDEAHGSAPKAPTDAVQTNQDMTSMQSTGTQVNGEASAHGDMAAGNGAAAADHDGASNGESGVIAVLKNLHPATVHFPIALVLMAALTELFAMRRGGTGLEGAVRVMIYGAAAGAVLATLFGWIHTGIWFGGDAVMQIHRWNGMALAVLGLALSAIARNRSESRTALRVLLFTMTALVIGQGYLGGELAHGTDHLGLFSI